MRRAIDAERLVAFEQLLATRDPRDLGSRGHRVTQPGKRDRFTTTWAPAARGWCGMRLVEAEGHITNWRSAVVVVHGRSGRQVARS